MNLLFQLFEILFEQLLIEYLLQFLIKVMGVYVEGFVEVIMVVVLQFDFGFDVVIIEYCLSKGGNYLGLIIIIMVISCEQFDEFYCILIMYLMVKVVF